MQILLLSADTYELPNEATGEILRGVTLFYLNDYRDPSGRSLGYKPTKISAPYELFSTLKNETLPAMAELQFTTRPGAGGKASAVVSDVKVLNPVELFI